MYIYIYIYIYVYNCVWITMTGRLWAGQDTKESSDVPFQALWWRLSKYTDENHANLHQTWPYFRNIFAPAPSPKWPIFCCCCCFEQILIWFWKKRSKFWNINSINFQLTKLRLENFRWKNKELSEELLTI